jgi:hypothetical protein
LILKSAGYQRLVCDFWRIRAGISKKKKETNRNSLYEFWIARSCQIFDLTSHRIPPLRSVFAGVIGSRLIMASAHSESQSLLHDFDTDDNQKRDLRDLPEVSSGSLEDGEEPSDECEALNKRRSLGFRERLRMSIRRRKIREGRRDGDVDGEEKRVEKYKWRKRICFLIPFIILTI